MAQRIGTLVGRGDMFRLVREFDWATTSLGSIETWSETLVSNVSLLLSSPLPATLSWGRELIFFYNDAAIPTVGAKHPQALGRSYREVFAEAWPLVGPDMEACLERGEAPIRENVRIPLLRDGELVYGYYTYALIPVYEAGVIAGVYDPYQNTTEAVLATQQLRASESRANRILQSIGDAVIVTDADGFVTRMNPIAEELIGWIEAEAQGKPLLEVFKIVREEDRSIQESPADKVKRLGTVVGLANHTILISKEGRETRIEDSGAPIPDEHGNLAGIVLVFRDVEERRALEENTAATFQELRNTHASLQLAMEIGGQGAFTYDGATQLITVDPLTQELFEMPETTGPAEYWISKVHEDDQERVAEAFAAAVSGGKPYDIEHRIVRSDGVRWLKARARLLSGPGDPVQLTGICEDTTDRKQQEDALRQTEKLAAVGRLAASIAHEINNPLESVTNLLYLARTSSDLQDVQQYLDTAERELRRVSVISNQTLRFHKQLSDPQPVSCVDLFDSVLSIYQGRLVNSHIDVEKRKGSDKKILCFDGEIRQVLNNLVGNAIDAMHPTGGRLLLRSRESYDWKLGKYGLNLTIADTGSGMPPLVARKAFEAFFTTKGIGGTGLGLWVSHDIVQRHRGSLRLRTSQREGHSGTVFTLFLPFDAVKR